MAGSLGPWRSPRRCQRQLGGGGVRRRHPRRRRRARSAPALLAAGFALNLTVALALPLAATRADTLRVGGRLVFERYLSRAAVSRWAGGNRPRRGARHPGLGQQGHPRRSLLHAPRRPAGAPRRPGRRLPAAPLRPALPAAARRRRQRRRRPLPHVLAVGAVARGRNGACARCRLRLRGRIRRPPAQGLAPAPLVLARRGAPAVGEGAVSLPVRACRRSAPCPRSNRWGCWRRSGRATSARRARSSSCRGR